MKNPDVYKLDRFIALKPANEHGVKWYLPFEEPLRLSGFYWFKDDMRYNRFPAQAVPRHVTQVDVTGQPVKVPFEECGATLLAANTAGGQIQFRSNSSRLLLKGELTQTGGMDHMALTGSGGFDLYVRGEDEPWRLVGVTRFDHANAKFSAELVADMDPGMRDFLIHFPLYNGVKELYVGLEEGAEALPPKPWDDEAPIVWYGTSILQGGCASRPGMAHTNILSRKLNRPILNFGFSGSGRGESEIANIIARVHNPAMIILDYDWNIEGPVPLAITLPVLIDIYRERHPQTPILVISHSPCGNATQKREAREKNWGERSRIQQEEVAKRQAAGDRHIFYVDGMTLMGDDWDECLVDGCHATDLGFYRMAESLLPVFRSLLKK